MTDINVGQIAEALNEKMDRNLVNADTIGQAILDKKVEVEALLEQNGYAKFTWKEGNKISNLIINWSGRLGDGSTFTYPHAYAKYVSAHVTKNSESTGGQTMAQSWLGIYGSPTLTSCTIREVGGFFFTIGQ